MDINYTSFKGWSDISDVSHNRIQINMAQNQTKIEEQLCVCQDAEYD